MIKISFIFLYISNFKDKTKVIYEVIIILLLITLIVSLIILFLGGIEKVGLITLRLPHKLVFSSFGECHWHL